ncbi:hypothetical protein [Frateuria aurantia]|uniref:Uncharacterized protein n=1 Tax=Frateuria aurantia (strain ATCC 33424 / DSM 6220 / KCTC 2777 / LMG 1558 / NBRC 3245 / NCIMB 13370) TaxID=767434 RepID=H8L1R3_FRAAD|nr:hypothetical protein [Frateuria aurantia]AFC85423.1 hypothetical protein Fraau_0955 [Frateuria aurantia DSM 6220]
MKNKMSDVRDHLVAMLESLGDPESNPEVIERAKATALVAGTYINAVKVEIDAIRLADEVGQLPAAIDATSARPIGRPSLQIQGTQ